MFKIWNRICYAPADEGGGGGEADDGGGSAEGGASSEGGADEGGEARVFAGKYKSVDDLEAGYSALEKKLGADDETRTEAQRQEFRDELRKDVPKAPENYEFKPPEGLVPEGVEFSMDTSNPVFTKWQKLSHEIGLTPDQFNAATALYVENELGILPNPEEQMALLGENAKARVERVDLWSAKHLSPESYKAVQDMSGNAHTITLLEEVMKLSADGASIGPGAGGDDQGELTRAEVEQMMRDPRYRDPRKRDPAFVKRVQDNFKRLFPNK